MNKQDDPRIRMVCSDCQYPVYHNIVSDRYECQCEWVVDHEPVAHIKWYTPTPDPAHDKTKTLLLERAQDYGPTWYYTSKVLKCLVDQNPQILDRIVEDGVVFHNWFYILGKLIRLLKSPRHLDTWQDIAGYARLVVDYIERGDINE